jgi:hypothetical protein
MNFERKELDKKRPSLIKKLREAEVRNPTPPNSSSSSATPKGTSLKVAHPLFVLRPFEPLFTLPPKPTQIIRTPTWSQATPMASKATTTKTHYTSTEEDEIIPETQYSLSDKEEIISETQLDFIYDKENETQENNR